MKLLNYIRNHKIITAAIVILLFFILTAIFFGVFSWIKTHDAARDAVNNQTTTTAGDSSGDNDDSAAIIKAFTSSDAIASIGTTYSVASTEVRDQASIASIYYTKDGSYTVQIPASASALLVQNDETSKTNSDTLVAQIETFMKSHNFSSTDNASPKDKLLTVYKNSTTVCQAVVLSKTDARAASVGLACVAASTISDSYQTIDNLLKLYEKDNASLSATAIYSDTVEQSPMKLTVLQVYAKDESASKRLYFATADGATWEYIGALSLSANASATSPGGQSTIPTSMQEKINDTKYGDFLKNNIQG